jgi:pSer/pThr/pTyr-binding forkhead associated (FHA) protein
MIPDSDITPGREAEKGIEAELVIQNGRQAGTRRALKQGPTIIGKAAECDLRLGSAEVAPYHCVLVNSPQGLLLRDLGSQSGTTLNGDLVVAATLRDGDHVAIGGHRLRVRLAGDMPTPLPDGTRPGTILYDSATFEREREALRIQAAAIDAQQAALTDQESRLERRRAALQSQEEQLTAHLESRKRELTALQEQVREERVALQRERDERERQGGEATEELSRARQDLQEQEQRVAARRERIVSLQAKLRQRWRKAWEMERDRVQQGQADLAAERSKLDHEREALQKEREALVQFRLRTNGESELLRRQLQAERIDLEQERHRRNKTLAELQKTMLELDSREQAVREMRRHVHRQKDQWERTRTGLEKEVQGLENRVNNLRIKLAESEQRLAQQQTDAAASAAGVKDESPPVAPPASQDSEEFRRLGDKLAVLERLAGELADQRLYLAEECGRLVRSQQAWHQERQAAAAALESAALKLLEREQAIVEQEHALAAAEGALKQRQKEQGLVRMHLEAWKSRLAARETNWQGTQERLLEKMRAREAIVEKQLASMQLLRQQWLASRRIERARLQNEFQQASEMRERYTRAWQEGQTKLYSLHKAQRALADRTLALERYRYELTGNSDDANRAERRIAQLQEEQNGTLGAAVQRLERHHQTLIEEGKQLEKRALQLEEHRRELECREQELSQRQMTSDQEKIAAETERTGFTEELQSMQNQCRHYEQQLAQLNEELERIASSLLGDAEGQGPTLARAA